MNKEQNIIQEANGLLARIGFRADQEGTGKYVILNRNGKAIAHGDLMTIYYCAYYMAQDAIEHPAKYENMNDPLDTNALYQAGVAMGKQLQK